MSYLNSFLLALVLLLTPKWNVFAQADTINLTLQEATTTALTSNKSLLMAQTDEAIAKANFRQTNAVFLPQAGLSYTAITTNNPLNVFGFKLQQQSVTASDFNPALLNNPSATENYMARADVQMPLLNMDMLYMRKAAHSQADMYHLQAERTKEYIAFEVQNAYLQLQLSYEAVLVLEEAYAAAKETYTFTENRFQKGLLQKSDLLNVKIQLTSVERTLAEAKSNVQNASDYLSMLMGKVPGVIYSAGKMAEISQVIPEFVADVPAKRADFQAMEKAIEATEYATKSGSMSYLPKLNAFGTYQFNDSEALGFSSESYLAGIQLSWDIFKGTKTKYTVTSKKLEGEKLRQQLDEQKDRSRAELAKNYRQLADTQLAVQQQLTAVEQAEESSRIIQNRYQQGLVNTMDVLMANTQRSQQKLNLSQAVFKHHITLAYLTFLTSTIQ
jgi:outer membrane protein TolC